MRNLLLVDDDTALATVVAEALRLRLGPSHGLDVDVRAGWDAAMEAAAQLGRIDVLLVDYHLGPHTGTDLCVALRAFHPDLAAILYTGKATPDVEAEARRCAMKVLWKPQRLGRITEVVQRLLDGEAA